MNGHGDGKPDIAAYADQAAGLLGLTLAPEHRAGVIANLTLLREISQPLLDFPLAAEIEAAPVFLP